MTKLESLDCLSPSVPGLVIESLSLRKNVPALLSGQNTPPQYPRPKDRSTIRAADPDHTSILGNFRMS